MIDEKTIEGLREYLKDHYVPSPETAMRTMPRLMAGTYSMTVKSAVVGARLKKAVSLRDLSDAASEYVKKHRKPGGFARALDGKRSEKGLSPAELYKAANIDRRQYSKYMGPEGKNPSKNTVISFGLALKLDRGEFDGLMQTAGYALSNSSDRDVCVMYCLENEIFIIQDVNILLFAIGAEPLTRE